MLLAKNLGRADEAIRLIELADLDVSLTDMMTVVIVGNQESEGLSAGRPLERQRRLALLHSARLRAAALREPGCMTVYFIGAGPGRPGTVDGGGPATDRNLPGLPLRRIACS